MSQTGAERVAEHIAESAREASRATSAIADAIDDGAGAVRRAVKQSGNAADKFLGDTTQRFRRRPALTLAATFAVGVAAGAFLGWMLKRR
jgi:hypothetical protein